MTSVISASSISSNNNNMYQAQSESQTKPQSPQSQSQIASSPAAAADPTVITKDETPRNSENSISTASLTVTSASSVADEELSWNSDQEQQAAATALEEGVTESNDFDDDEDEEEPDVQELLDMFDTIDTIQVGRQLTETPSKIFKRQPSSSSSSSSIKEVRFSTVQIREYPIELGDNPSGDRGPPITIGWDHHREMEVSVDHNEDYGYDADEKSISSDQKRVKRSMENLHLSHLKRMCKLHHCGYSSQEIGRATREAKMERRKREETLRGLRNEKLEEYKEAIKRAIRNATVDRKAKKQEKAFLKPFRKSSSTTTTTNNNNNNNNNRPSKIVNTSGELPNAKTYEDEGGFWYY